jgi:hypothetical protein
MDSTKLLQTGFEYKFTWTDGAGEIIRNLQAGLLKDEDIAYNVRWMVKNGYK